MDRKVSQSKHYSFRVPGKWVTSYEWHHSDIPLRRCEEWTLEMPYKHGLNRHSESRAETSRPRNTFRSINLCSSLGFWCYQALERTNKAIRSLWTRQLPVWILGGTLTDQRWQPEALNTHYPPDFGDSSLFWRYSLFPASFPRRTVSFAWVPLSFLSRQTWRMYVWLGILKKKKNSPAKLQAEFANI